PKWLLAMPLAWLGWQFLAAAGTVSAPLSRAALAQFSACGACFYLGYFSLGRVREHRPFWLGVLGAFIVVLVVGLQQHFGGLAETRRYFWAYIYPQLKSVPPEYLKKMSSNRIFSTLFYPNTLAGALLLLLPPALAVFGNNRRWPVATRWLVAGVVGAAGLACLYWSGSKGGWLLMLVLGGVALLRLPFSRRLKILLTGAALIFGLAAFAVKYSAYFEKGATSVVARLDCWRAALQTVERSSLLGSGPGTFGVIYERIKRPEAEMARLTHNDYLEQASDSGLPGFFAYLIFIAGSLIWAGRKLAATRNPETFCLWLGLLGWSLQETFEFGLYIPAVAWTAFALLGWLVRQAGDLQDRETSANRRIHGAGHASSSVAPSHGSSG
ncbi:MAG: O-antigen ligase family protein, partial [Verrucomicrobia bacterium]|nr:O-antigen ligase family protein [Verrucomicrobiota bacterium]